MDESIECLTEGDAGSDPRTNNMDWFNRIVKEIWPHANQVCIFYIRLNRDVYASSNICM